MKNPENSPKDKNDIYIQNECFEVFIDDKGTFINNKLTEYRQIQVAKNRHLFVLENKSFDIEVLKVIDGRYQVKVDGKEVSLEILDRQKQILRVMGFATSTENELNEICSPMPGAIIEIACHEGQDVQKGDKLFILEAMKMENIIKAPASGTVGAIKVAKGDRVEKNQTLLVF